MWLLSWMIISVKNQIIPYLKFLQLTSAIVSNLKVFPKNNKRNSLPHIFISLKNLQKFLIINFFGKFGLNDRIYDQLHKSHFPLCILKLFLREQFFIFCIYIFTRHFFNFHAGPKLLWSQISKGPHFLGTKSQGPKWKWGPFQL